MSKKDNYLQIERVMVTLMLQMCEYLFSTTMISVIAKKKKKSYRQKDVYEYAPTQPLRISVNEKIAR
jgi:hypothetical protein